MQKERIYYLIIQIKSTGVFPSSKAPKVLWLGIGTGINKLALLQQQVEKVVKKYTDHYKKIIFLPHITVARIRNSNRKIDVLPFLGTVYSPIELKVNSIYLYESNLLPEGVQYSILNTFPLN